MTVSVVDYGVGNLGSVINMFKRIGADAIVVSKPDEIGESDRVLLPGVGSFDHGVERLTAAGLIEPLRTFASTGKPLMGICLGMQLLFDSSEEGGKPGLGLIPGQSRRFGDVPGLRVPHMGWNSVAAVRPDPLLDGIESDNRFYFVHSYHVVPAADEHTLATSEYGHRFSSMVRADNVMGAQFHPEKSHTFGMTVLRNFAGL